MAFLQFADFLPLAFNQILCELGSMYWRTGGHSSPLAPREGNHHAERDAYYGWQCPVIVMIACGGYRPGLGPFHSQTLESIAAHTPGIDVVMPSTAADAADLLDAAFASGRPTLFFYPKACLNQLDRAISRDVAHQFLPLGHARRVPLSVGNGLRAVPSRTDGSSVGFALPADDSVGNGLRAVPRAADAAHLPLPPGAGRGEGEQTTTDANLLPYSSPLAPREGNHHAERDAYYDETNPALTFVTWGNTVEHCLRAAESLAGVGIKTDVLDLRSLSPWDEHAVLESVSRTRRLVVVHEDNLTCGFGAEVLATVLEKCAVPVKARRVARPDTFVPCHFGNQLEVLPSHRRVLSAACELLDIELTWQDEPPDEAGVYTIDAIGSGPADEAVTVIDVLVERGMRVTIGDALANVEASKAVVTIQSTVSGIIDDVLIAAGDTVPIGNPLFRIRTSDARRKPLTRERIGTPVFRRAPYFSGGGQHQRMLQEWMASNAHRTNVKATQRPKSPAAK